MRISDWSSDVCSSDLIVTADGDLGRAIEGQAVTLTLTDEIDASRGDIIAAASSPAEVADQFAAHLLWLGEQPLLPGRPYWLKIGSRTVGAHVTEINHKVDVNTQEELAATHRLDERRAGNDSVITCITRWSPLH